jgi:glycosyltransferase involved in cell wall biosynthesis
VKNQLTVGINAIPLLSPLTGIGQYSFHLITELQKLLQVPPYLFYGHAWNQQLRIEPFPKINQIKRFIKMCIPFSYHLGGHIRQHYFNNKDIINKIQVYHDPNFVPFKYKGPTVTTIHDLSYIHFREYHPKLRIQWMDRKMPRAIKQTQHFITDSEYTKQEMIQYYRIREDQVTAIPLGAASFFETKSKTSCHEILKAYGLNYQKYILTVGTLEPRKNIITLLHAYNKLPNHFKNNYPLVIVGMNGWNTDNITTELKNTLQSNKIIVTGYVPNEHLPFLYSAATAFVYPSIYEGFGLPPLEAMQCSSPVIVSNSSSLPEVVGDAAMLISPHDIDGWSQAMQQMIEDTQLNSFYRQAGCERAKLFSWQKCAQETLRVYEGVVS